MTAPRNFHLLLVFLILLFVGSTHAAWWDGFDEGLNGRVRALTIFDGLLIAGGDFGDAGEFTLPYGKDYGEGDTSE